jgi:starch-binding outer membrane protein, SusD/RagB family
MMKLKKLAIIILAVGSMATACTKTLDVTPQQSVNANEAIQTPEDVDQMVIGAYAIMGGPQLYGTNLFLLPDLLAGNLAAGAGSASTTDPARYITWQGTFQGQRQAYRKNMTRDNSESARTWVSAYQAINNANIVLANLDKVTDPDQKNQLEGEALLIRGVMHFELVRLFALPWNATAGNTQPGVVIQTTPTYTKEEAAVSKARSTVAEVYAAVLADMNAAATKLPEENGTRFNAYTAQAFLSRVYLQQSNYAAALTAASAVIESGFYRLNASVGAVFSNRNTAESIFEIQQNDQNNAGQDNDGMATFYASIPGIGRGDARVPGNFPTLYPAGDLRATEWYYQGRPARPGVYSGKWKSFTQNLPVIRLAEMYLTRAECNLRLGTVVGATPAQDLAMVRNPVRTNSVAPANPTLADILNERLLELAYEGHRIHDIRRLQGSVGDFAWNANELVMPIPAREVDATGGVITQNPGY